MRPRSVEALVAAVSAGHSFEYLCFYGHTNTSGLVNASCLSNFYPAQFELDGLRWPSSEHYMMHSKAALFGDTVRMGQIRKAPTCADAKKLGRKVTPYGDASWAAHRYEAVRRACEAKFGQHADLRAFLVGTGDAILVEAAPRDTVWGIGLGAKNDAARDPRQWRGSNLLGFALMDVREALGAE